MRRRRRVCLLAAIVAPSAGLAGAAPAHVYPLAPGGTEYTNADGGQVAEVGAYSSNGFAATIVRRFLGAADEGDAYPDFGTGVWVFNPFTRSLGKAGPLPGQRQWGRHRERRPHRRPVVRPLHPQLHARAKRRAGSGVAPAALPAAATAAARAALFLMRGLDFFQASDILRAGRCCLLTEVPPQLLSRSPAFFMRPSNPLMSPMEILPTRP
jgi:hypothetical protein